MLAAAERLMRRTGDIRRLVRELIGEARDPFFQPPFLVLTSDIASGIMLYDDENVTISVGVTGADALAAKKSGERGPASIHFNGLRTVFHFLKAGGATLSFWEAPPIADHPGGGEGARCRLVERRRIDDGERVALDGRTQSFVIEHATSDIVCIQAAVHAEGAPLAVEYDCRSLEFVGASSTDEGTSRVQMMVSLIRAMDRRDAAPVLEELLAGSDFYTRWYIMRELLALDAEAALPGLRRMAATDAHPEVRDAAAATLATFFGDAREQAA
ncbi:MAG TPA: HEAT repeat domain-containing protein [Allosphingosinicella sp.]|nr:HEAT repeat domain-containing protein [Allosphingosinicella sp.]